MTVTKPKPPTIRYASDGHRETRCPLCGQWVRITNRQDDTRWRIMRHGPTTANKIRCDGSGELVAAIEPPLTRKV